MVMRDSVGVGIQDLTGRQYPQKRTSPRLMWSPGQGLSDADVSF